MNILCYQLASKKAKLKDRELWYLEWIVGPNVLYELLLLSPYVVIGPSIENDTELYNSLVKFIGRRVEVTYEFTTSEHFKEVLDKVITYIRTIDKESVPDCLPCYCVDKVLVHKKESISKAVGTDIKYYNLLESSFNNNIEKYIARQANEDN